MLGLVATMMLSILAMASALAFNLASNSSCLALLAGLIIPCNHSLLVYLSSWNFLGVGGNKSWIPNFLASLNKSADLLRENFAQLPDSWFCLGKMGFSTGLWWLMGHPCTVQMVVVGI